MSIAKQSVEETLPGAEWRTRSHPSARRNSRRKSPHTDRLVADRYRPITPVGRDVRVQAEFWRAHDTVLDRCVALTLLSQHGALSGVARTQDALCDARRWGAFGHTSCARLLDVLSTDSRDRDLLGENVDGMVITEWVPGLSLAQVIAAGPLAPSAVLDMLDPLAAAALAAHRQGLVLGCVHPQRIRITPYGVAALAFTVPRTDMALTDDIRGLGAALYALLTGQWPLPDAYTGFTRPAALRSPSPDTTRSPDRPQLAISPEIADLAMDALCVAQPRVPLLTSTALRQRIATLRDAQTDATVRAVDNPAALCPSEPRPHTAATAATSRSRSWWRTLSRSS